MNKIERLNEIINHATYVVFFGGAGVSTESGLKDFRSVDGIYSLKYNVSPEEILSHHFFEERPKEFYQFYKDKLLISNIKPNACHFKLTELEENGILKAIITQNIDGLHQASGSKNVIELHGSIYKNHCTICHHFYEGYNFITSIHGTPRCNKCGGIIKPDVVLYEEMLDKNVLNKAINEISKADVLIIGGTSLSVYPAADLIHYFKGKELVIINKSITPQDNQATLLINDYIGKVMSQIVLFKK